MTVSSSTNKFRYIGNGSTDTFAITGRIFATGDYTVQLLTRATDAVVETLTETTDYTITINGPESASVVVVSGKIPSSTQDILIFRDLAQTQTVDLPTGTRFPAVSVENALDKTTALVQDLSETISRTIQIPINSSATIPGIGSLTTDEVVVYDGTDFITDGTTTTDIQNAATNAAAAASSASAASSSATLAGNWATKTDGVVSGSDYSAKAWAIGGTGTTTNNAKYWSEQAAAFAGSIDLPALGAADTVLQVNAGGTALEYGKIALANMASGTDGNLITFDSSGDPAYVATGTAGQVLTSAGAGAPPTFESLGASATKEFIDDDTFATASSTTTASSESIKAYVDGASTFVQRVIGTTASMTTTTTAIPYDDTIPQNTEGAEVVTVAITPTNSSNKLVIRAVLHLGTSATCRLVAAIFQDSTASALSVSSVYSPNNEETTLYVEYTMTAGTTSPTTFKLRGGGSAGTITFNGLGGARFYGGALISSISVEEIKA